MTFSSWTKADLVRIPKRRAAKRKPITIADVTPESAVVRFALDYLRAEGLVPIRIFTGEVTTKDGHRVVGADEGTPDLFTWLNPYRSFCPFPDSIPRSSSNPLPLFIECKRPKGGRLRLAQKQFRDRALEDGCVYLQMRSPEDLKRVLPPRMGS